MSAYPESLIDRLFRNRSIDQDTQCWQWTGYRTRKGYGKMAVAGTSHNAHRVAYMAFVGEIPEGLEIDHLCSNRGCINPIHLEAVTPEENKRRSSTQQKSHCKQGHAFDQGNTRLHLGIYRICRACDRLRAKKYGPKRRALRVKTFHEPERAAA